MIEPILFVDDDIHVISAFQRSLCRSFQISIAQGPVDGLRAVRSGTGFAVVVSDLRMPEMNGIEFLTKVREATPQTVRILLTGQADLDAAIAAVNDGHIFRFLNKPCSRALMADTLAAALNQYRLERSERELLQETLVRTVAVLVEVLGAVHPQVFGSSMRVREYVSHMTDAVAAADPWQFEAAAMLCQLGYVTIPPAVMKKYHRAENLSAPELRAILRQPAVGGRLIHRIPRLQAVAQMIERQHRPFEPAASLPAEKQDVHLGAQMLAVAVDLDRLIERGTNPRDALGELRRRDGRYNPELLNAMERFDFERERTISGMTSVADGRPYTAPPAG